VARFRVKVTLASEESMARDAVLQHFINPRAEMQYVKVFFTAAAPVASS